MSWVILLMEKEFLSLKLLSNNILTDLNPFSSFTPPFCLAVQYVWYSYKCMFYSLDLDMAIMTIYNKVVIIPVASLQAHAR